MPGMYLLIPLAFAALVLPQEPLTSPASSTSQDEVIKQLSSLGVRLDLTRQLIEIDGFVCQDREPLEYLIVNQHGKKHEALLRTENVSAEALNTAMLLCGTEVGVNVNYIPVDPMPTKEEFKNGAPMSTEVPASGAGFYIYVAWTVEKADGAIEPYLFRAEDLVVNVNSDRSYHRAPFVYLGSRFIKPHKDVAEMFAADAEGNIVSLVYFKPANHLLTGNDPDASNQYVWYPNAFLLPEIGAPVKILFSRKPLEQPTPFVSIKNL